MDITALSYWFPKLEAAGLPVPKTIIIAMPEKTQEQLFGVFDGEEPDMSMVRPFYDQIAKAGDELGWPCFLRTDHTSAKHSWQDACFLPSADVIGNHVLSIIEFSEMCDIVGLPWSNWAVREMLPTKPVGTCPNYGEMPISREYRYFVQDGQIVCDHPYWPKDALEQGGAPHIDFDKLFYAVTDKERADLRALAEAASVAIPGAWSVDILDTERGWFITDMAEAHKSYHWRDCKSVPAKTGAA